MSGIPGSVSRGFSTQFQKTAIQRPPRPFFTVAKVGVASSSLVFRSKRLAVLRGVFVCGPMTMCFQEVGDRRSCMFLKIKRFQNNRFQTSLFSERLGTALFTIRY